MKQRICDFLSSTAALATALSIVMGAMVPVEWWQRLLLIAIVTPIVVAANSRYFGTVQLWHWRCGESRPRRDKADDR